MKTMIRLVKSENKGSKNMNALQFLKNELEHYQVAAKVFDDFGYVSCHFFKNEVLLGDGHVELRLSSDGSIKILSQQTQIFYTAEATAKFIRILQVAAEIGSSWEAAIEDEKVHIPAIASAKQEYDTRHRKIDAVKVYRALTGLGWKGSKDAVEAMIKTEFPIHTCAPKPITDEQVEQAFDDIVEIVETVKAPKTYNGIPEIVIEQFFKVRDTGLTNMYVKSGVQYEANGINCHELVIWIEDNKRGYGELLIAVSDYQEAQESTS